MLKKIGNLFNVKNWIESFLLKTVVNKGVKHAVTAIVGIITGAKVSALLSQYGVTVDPNQLTVELSAIFSGVVGWVFNWALKAMDKDGDGKIG